MARLVQVARELHPTPRFADVLSGGARAALSSTRRANGSVKTPCALWPAPMASTSLGRRRCTARGTAKPAAAALHAARGRAGSRQQRARFSLLFVQDLADAVRHPLEQPDWRPGPFEIHDGRPGGYLGVWPDGGPRSSAGRAGVRIPGVARAAARVNLRLAHLCGGLPMLTPGKVRELTHPDWVCDDAPLRRRRPAGTRTSGPGWAGCAAARRCAGRTGARIARP